MMNIKTEISVGEFLDKMTILQIKAERIQDDSKLININKELSILNDIWKQSPFSQYELGELITSLKTVNEKLWDIEDRIRDKEKMKSFDEEFIELARSVYFTNDVRADIKKEINIKSGSELIEEKSYSDYT